MPHVNESCHMWTRMSHVTHEQDTGFAGCALRVEWVCVSVKSALSFIALWCLSNVTCGRVMSHVNESCHMWTSHVTCERVMSHVNESCHVWHSAMKGNKESSERWVESALPLIESCHGVSSERCPSLHYGARGKPRVNESCHMWTSHVTCERVMSHVNESCHMW